MRFIFFLINIFSFTNLFSQVNLNVTQQDYNKYIYDLDYSSAKRFADSNNQLITRFQQYDYRKYGITYYDLFTEKITESKWDKSKESVISFENFVSYEIQRRKDEEKERIRLLKIEEEEKQKILLQEK